MYQHLTHTEEVAIVQNTYDACLWFDPYVPKVAIYFEERHRAHFEKVHARFMARMDAYAKKSKPWTANKVASELTSAKWVQAHPYVIRRVFRLVDDAAAMDALLKSVTCGHPSSFDFSTIEVGGCFLRIEKGDSHFMVFEDYEKMRVTQQANDLLDELSSNDVVQKAAAKKLKI